MKVPEKIDMSSCHPHNVINKMNDIIDYLKSKENKKQKGKLNPCVSLESKVKEIISNEIQMTDCEGIMIIAEESIKRCTQLICQLIITLFFDLKKDKCAENLNKITPLYQKDMIKGVLCEILYRSKNEDIISDEEIKMYVNKIVNIDKIVNILKE